MCFAWLVICLLAVLSGSVLLPICPTVAPTVAHMHQFHTDWQYLNMGSRSTGQLVKAQQHVAMILTGLSDHRFRLYCQPPLPFRRMAKLNFLP